jgi:hypothetical protein
MRPRTGKRHPDVEAEALAFKGFAGNEELAND